MAYSFHFDLLLLPRLHASGRQEKKYENQFSSWPGCLAYPTQSHFHLGERVDKIITVNCKVGPFKHGPSKNCISSTVRKLEHCPTLSPPTGLIYPGPVPNTCGFCGVLSEYSLTDWELWILLQVWGWLYTSPILKTSCPVPNCWTGRKVSCMYMYVCDAQQCNKYVTLPPRVLGCSTKDFHCYFSCMIVHNQD